MFPYIPVRSSETRPTFARCVGRCPRATLKGCHRPPKTWLRPDKRPATPTCWAAQYVADCLDLPYAPEIGLVVDAARVDTQKVHHRSAG